MQRSPHPAMPMRALFVGVALSVGFATSAAAQQGPTCDDERYREFDFWLGEWEVENLANGQTAGTNIITSILGGCVLHENYSTPRGYAGQSFNAFDRQTGQWQQTWVDVTGLVLNITGGLVDGRMVLEGPGRNQEGEPVRNRITWTPHEDGTVQQTWEISADDGETWSVAFDGLYRRKGS